MPEDTTNDIHQINQTLVAMLLEAQCVCRELKSIAASLQTIAAYYKITGITVNLGIPQPNQGSQSMKISLVKKSALTKTAAKSAKGAAAPVAFQLIDNQNDTCTVMGVDSAGNQLDISSVATLTPAPTSDNTAVLTIGAPTGMTFNMKAVGPTGSANVTATATWNDGSIGPFSFTLPVNVSAAPAGGIVIVPGVPVLN
jgi:hypothetical protein